MSPLVASTRDELAAALSSVRRSGGRVALVPTMGALHEGHAALMDVGRTAVTERGALVASIFVNPMQFGPHEDLAKYPRTLSADLAVCAERGVDIVYSPMVEDVYPGGEPRVTVDPGPDSESLEGRVRPGHLRGVATVVAKLFGLVRPDVAVFGQKDYEQLVLVRRMVADLCMAVEIVGAVTVREADGLALSSRNGYLTEAERISARSLSAALRAGVAAADAGPLTVLDAARGVLATAPEIAVDYLDLRAPDLGPVPDEGEARLLVAGRVGTTRLIDNMSLTLARGAPDEVGS